MISASPSPTPKGKAAYPISSFTWLLIPAKFADAAKRDAMKDFLKWMLTDGQQYCEAPGLRETAEGSGRQGNEGNRADSVSFERQKGEHIEMATTPNAATPADVHGDSAVVAAPVERRG